MEEFRGKLLDLIDDYEKTHNLTLMFIDVEGNANYLTDIICDIEPRVND